MEEMFGDDLQDLQQFMDSLPLLDLHVLEIGLLGAVDLFHDVFIVYLEERLVLKLFEFLGQLIDQFLTIKVDMAEFLVGELEGWLLSDDKMWFVVEVVK